MPDVIAVEVFNKIFFSIAEEMGIILARSSFSPNIKERRDFSCAIFDGSGELVAQAGKKGENTLLRKNLRKALPGK